MKTRSFGRTAWQVSEIGYGMWGMAGWTGSEDADMQNPHTPLLTSVANAFGANLTAFGDPAYPGELQGL